MVLMMAVEISCKGQCEKKTLSGPCEPYCLGKVTIMEHKITLCVCACICARVCVCVLCED